MNDDKKRAAAAAEIFAEARRRNARVTLPPDLLPRDLDEGTAIQDALAQRLGFEWAGWKLGLTSAAGQAREGFSRPFTGRMLKGAVKNSPAAFPAGMFNQPLLESEIAFRMARALPGGGRTFTREQVLDAVDSAFIGLEIADLRYAASWPLPMPLLAADNGAAGGFVIGPDIAGWRERDLTLIEAGLEINGKHAADNLIAAERTDAVAALVWAANELARRGFPLAAGEVVTTGSATRPTRCDPGTTAIARFAGVGEVRAVL